MTTTDLAPEFEAPPLKDGRVVAIAGHQPKRPISVAK